MNRHIDMMLNQKSLIPQITFRKKMLFVFLNLILYIFRIYPVNSKKILYWPKNLKFQDNTKALFLYWQQQSGFEHVWLMNRKNGQPSADFTTFQNTRIIFLNSLSVFYHLATAKYWIREIEVASPGLQARKETIVVQLWHASGAFKKFGLDIEGRSNDLRRYRFKDARRWDLLLCSSKKVSKIYSKAFGGIDENKIFITGLPRNDFLFRCQKTKDTIRKKFNIPLKSKLVLYAPTFRDKGIDFNILDHVVGFINRSLPKDYLLGVRLHPAVANKISFNDKICNLSFYETESVLSISDMLITDYSSIIFDYALLERPMLFYSPDLDEYCLERGLYFEYAAFVPGPLSKTKELLLDQITTYDFNKWRPVIQKFRQDFQPDFDGENAKRIFERIMTIKR